MSELTPIQPQSNPALPMTPPVPAPTPVVNTAAPGWYADPQAPGLQRWWTGKDWSDHTQPSQPSAPAPLAQTTVIVNQRKGPNHAFHLIMTLVTLGLWLPVWIIVAIAS